MKKFIALLALVALLGCASLQPITDSTKPPTKLTVWTVVEGVKNNYGCRETEIPANIEVWTCDAIHGMGFVSYTGALIVVFSDQESCQGVLKGIEDSRLELGSEYNPVILLWGVAQDICKEAAKPKSKSKHKHGNPPYTVKGEAL